jgi:methyltransferase (TIGR00027 family)
MKPVSKTAYYCCGIRMQDAESEKPLIGDKYAKLLLGKEGVDYWQEFKEFEKPNASNLARHYIIDNHVKKLLQDHPGSTIIIIGAGFDSRAYRFTSGKWIEIDEPAIIEYKNQKLPVEECSNKLERIAIDFEKEKLRDKLAPYAQQPNVIIIIEGVLLYLNASQKNELLQTLTTLFPKHILFCDLMTKKFFNKLGKSIHEKLSAHGSSFADMIDHPNKIFLEYDYQQMEVISTIKTAIKLGLTHLPKFVVNVLFRNLIMGYSVYSFSYDQR